MNDENKPINYKGKQIDDSRTATALFVSLVIAIHFVRLDIVDYHSSRLTLANKFDSKKKLFCASYYPCFASCKGTQNI